MDEESKQQEKEKIKSDILTALSDREALKKELLDEIKLPKNNWATAMQHPAVLIVLGFILTGIVGGALSSYWQNQQKIKEQYLLAKHHELEQKSELSNEAVKTIRECTYAINCLLSLIVDV